MLNDSFDFDGGKRTNERREKRLTPRLYFFIDSQKFEFLKLMFVAAIIEIHTHHTATEVREKLVSSPSFGGPTLPYEIGTLE